MKYTVTWLPSAEAELARLYNEAKDKSAITRAANEIDRVLKRSPHQAGESRTGNMRIEKPLG